jgi:hypothetical protein
MKVLPTGRLPEIHRRPVSRPGRRNRLPDRVSPDEDERGTRVRAMIRSAVNCR